MEKAALILEGGGLRQMFTDGVVDQLINREIEFEYTNGVSAGAMCGINYLTKQAGRNRDINLKFINDPRYMSMRNLFSHGDIFDFNFMLHGEVEKEYPFDYDKMKSTKQKMEITATNCVTGEANYFKKTDPSVLTALLASASMPLLSKQKYINGIPYLDGGIADSIPVERAKKLGYKKIVVVLTRDRTYWKKANSGLINLMARCRYHKYPEFVEKFVNRPQRYNETLKKIRNDKSIFVIEPNRPVTIARTENDAAKLESLYNEGKLVINSRMDQLEEYLDKKD